MCKMITFCIKIIVMKDLLNSNFRCIKNFFFDFPSRYYLIKNF